MNECRREQPVSWLFHRPLSAYINLVLDAGCSLYHILEPQLTIDAARELGNDRDVHVPSFVVIGAVKGGAADVRT